MEKQKRERKVWLYGFVFLMFGLVLGLVIFNSGISGNAIFNLPGVSKPAPVTPIVTESTTTLTNTLMNITPNTAISQICKKTGYMDSIEVNELIAKYLSSKTTTPTITTLKVSSPITGPIETDDIAGCPDISGCRVWAIYNGKCLYECYIDRRHE